MCQARGVARHTQKRKEDTQQSTSKISTSIVEVDNKVVASLEQDAPEEATSPLDEATLLTFNCLNKYYGFSIKNGGCDAFFDSLLCWPPTDNNTLAILACPQEVHGIQYDTSKNATRLCDDGKWADFANYDDCSHLEFNATTSLEAEYVELPTIIYYTGYTVSLLALLLAVVVFINFKDLRCLRNTIHANLFVTYIMTSFLWILTLTLQMLTHPGPVTCIFLTVLFQYFSLTNFCWMLVEGLYLYMLVVETFSGDNLRFGMYAFIGWGCPAIFVLCWAIARAITSGEPTEPQFQKKLEIECSWMREKQIDWIIHGPSLAVLAINCVFLVRIMWVVYKVLITKLRSANTAETRQYRKASKALLVLLPLLGITYLVVLMGPNEGVMRSVFDVFRAVLLSTQGFSVSLFFCFLNSEVRHALHHKFVRWRDERNIGNPSSRNRRCTISRDYSPRSRTESIRMTAISNGSKLSVLPPTRSPSPKETNKYLNS